jgi:hypothetical protein
MTNTICCCVIRILLLPEFRVLSNSKLWDVPTTVAFKVVGGSAASDLGAIDSEENLNEPAARVQKGVEEEADRP